MYTQLTKSYHLHLVNVLVVYFAILFSLLNLVCVFTFPFHWLHEHRKAGDQLLVQCAQWSPLFLNCKSVQMWAIKAMIDSRLRLCSQIVYALLKARLFLVFFFFCSLIVVFCKSFLATSVVQSQLCINLFLIKKVLLRPENWELQALLLQEEDRILMCGNIFRV